MKKVSYCTVFLLFNMFFNLLILSTLNAAEVQNLRLGKQNKDTSRLVLDLSDRPEHKIFLLKDPYRIVIDIEKSFPSFASDSITTTNDYVKDIRIGNVNGKNMRVVIETKDAAIVDKAFFLPPQGGFNWRFVVDIKSSDKAKFDKAKSGETSKTSFNPKQIEISGKDSSANINQLQNVAPKRQLIVLDPGHGGKDSGAISISGYYEKYITLRMAKELQAELEKTGRYIVKLTRTEDIALPLRSRVQIARNTKANLFISIHADSAFNSSAKGLSVYTLSETSSDKETAALAERENKADAIIDMDFSDKSPEVANILIDLARRDTMNTSKELANFMAKEMSKNVKVLPNTHRFAGFAVLKAQDIPSVLVEIGYLSNREEDRLLSNSGYRNKLAKSLTKAIDKFFEAHLPLED